MGLGAGVDLNYVGYAIAALFVVTWGVALAVWRFGRHRGALDGAPRRRDRGRGAAVTKAPRRAPLILRDLEQAEDAVRDGGMRLTAARRTVLAALFAADGPVSAEEIAAGLGGRVTLTEISSVYRNLELLEQLGVVRHLHAGHGPGRYVLERAAERGYLACESCGAIVTLEGAALESVRDAVRSARGFEPDLSHFPVVGRCAGCA